MLRYNLDSLGWYQFEWLVQALMKAELGAFVESWGGTGDWGRDAYSPGPLPFPGKGVISQGPFLFQAKFVDGANAAGARPTQILLDACRKEILRIRSRIEMKQWKEPQHYGLLTNVAAGKEVRRKVQDSFAGVTKATVTVLGGNDICDLLDAHTNIARAFPQILSLRNLDTLLDLLVNKEVVQRSRAAIEAARDVIPVFVPTAVYNRAWKVVAKEHFVVLEGPPEMGKTAIAWMIAIAQLASGWEAIACDQPRDFFSGYRPEASQIFVADDAFGRTEYDPTMGNKWEKQLERVVTQLDERHWLLWTSRKHILERARREMDLQGRAVGFPHPGDVLVNAAELTRREKALILYRHAKHANLESETKLILKKNAVEVVQDPSFTPERIRRFIVESLPRLTRDLKEGHLQQKSIQDEIHSAIQNPTDRMTKTFRALPVEYKWVLISLLEQGHSPNLEDLRASFKRLSGHEDNQRFSQIVEELSEAFIRL